MKDTHHTAFLLKALDWLLGRIGRIKTCFKSRSRLEYGWKIEREREKRA